MEKLLIVLVVIIGVIAIAQMMKVYEISSKMRGKKEEEISHSDNVFNANMMIVFMLAFYALFFWLLAKYGNGGIGPSASYHGADLDWLLNFNFLIIIIVFFLCNTLLFVFAFKYYHKGPGTKAYWFTHDNKLELIWTAIPAVVLAVIIILGLRAWNEMTDEPGKGAKEIELYSKQYSWTARYAGENNMLGRADFRMNNTENPLGVLTKLGMEKRQDELRGEIVALVIKLYKHKGDSAFFDKINRNVLITYSNNKADTAFFLRQLKRGIRSVDSAAAAGNVLTAWDVLSKKNEKDSYDKMQRLQRHLLKIVAVGKTVTEKDDVMAMDDFVVTELYLFKDQEYEFKFRSMDVIHSAYFPHFRAQMNTVPGMITRFKFTPRYTTTEMRKHMQNDKFEYVLLCNKICGAGHQNMQMRIVVLDKKNKEDMALYTKWVADAKTMKEILYPEEAVKTDEKPAADTTKAPANNVAALQN